MLFRPENSRRQGHTSKRCETALFLGDNFLAFNGIERIRPLAGLCIFEF